MAYGGFKEMNERRRGTLEDPGSKHQIQPQYGDDEQTDAGRDCRTRIARTNSQARTWTIFPIQLTTNPVDPYSCFMCDHNIGEKPTVILYTLLGCGSFVRGRKRKKVDSRPFIY